ncbi:MAG: RnfH family protein [Pseudomonadaceae bacterium]|nr:RnfH family protein [Pseudomonadaceae bacterium]
MAVEVVLAEPNAARRTELAFSEGMTVAMALAAAAEQPAFWGAEITSMAVGVYGEVVQPEHELRDGDRIELYRPLVADPKESRRLRADGKL